VYCPECGFHQSDAVHTYCEKCGALLPDASAPASQTTGPFSLSDAEGHGHHGIDGPALAVRTGGGISGEVFHLSSGQITIGRDPKSAIFLDDVTVSRHHATLTVGAPTVLTDLGSLNGTYVNRRRIEGDEELIDGDELQIGKFRLVFIA
jgi:hypothetical protein